MAARKAIATDSGLVVFSLPMSAPVDTVSPASRLPLPRAKPPRPLRDGTLQPPAWWLWPHLLSLDAPLVAVAWQRWWAQAAHLSLPPYASAVLGLGVWMIYLADRLADAARCRMDDLATPRHAFHSRQRLALSSLAIMAAGLLVALTPCLLPRAEFLPGLLLALLASAYFWLIHCRERRGWTKRVPKEAAVGGMFALGTAFFPWCRGGVDSVGTMLGVVLFGGICFCNCALITAWERQTQDLRDPASLLNAFPALSTQLRKCCLVLACLSGGSHLCTGSGLFFPLTLSSLLLALLDQQRPRFSPDALRVLADATLLTPLLCESIGILVHATTKFVP